VQGLKSQRVAGEEFIQRIQFIGNLLNASVDYNGFYGQEKGMAKGTHPLGYMSF